MSSQVVVRSVPGQRFTQEVIAGKHKLLADEPESVGGSDRGPGPYDYLLACILNGRILKESGLVFRLAIKKKESASIVQRNTSWQYQRTQALP